jgi:arginine repressor
MVASFLDSGAVVQIIGTIAGDDTVLAILRERTPQDAVLNGLASLFPDIRSKYIR